MSRSEMSKGSKGTMKVTKGIKRDREAENPIQKKEVAAKESSSEESSVEKSGSESEDASSEESQSESEDEDLDDEVASDLDDVSSDSESDSNSDSESESDDEIPKKKKKKTDDGSESFANAFNSIIGSKLKAYDRSEPIMARNKVVLKKLESDKLEHKAKRALLAEKKQLYNKHRVKNLLPTGEDNVRQILEHEKKLKKTAQKGVVKLFNAVLATQVKTTQALSKEKVGQTKKEELFNEMSKEQFLDMVQSAGTN